jgi:hypothetical protein
LEQIERTPRLSANTPDKEDTVKKPAKIMLCIATLVPLLLFISLFVLMFSQFFFIVQEDVSPPTFPAFFLVIFGLRSFMGLWSIELLISYLMNVFCNGRVTQSQRALWAVVLFLGSVIAMLVYWYLYIWREPKDTVETVA